MTTSVILAPAVRATQLQNVLPGRIVVARDASELETVARRGGCVAFVEADQLDRLRGSLGVPVVAVVEPKLGLLNDTITLLDRHGWLSHVIAASLLATPRAPSYLAAVLERLSNEPDTPAPIGTGIGRRACLAQASRREQRLDRMREFFAGHALSERMIVSLVELGEELVMNALYDAPVEAGFFTTPRQRYEDVTLPSDRACEISYGVDAHAAFVRVRDPFGALSRSRLLQVLNRCKSKDVRLDESRGGAGLGLWRIFSATSSVTITVVPGVVTDVVARVSLQGGRGASRLEAVHLFFVATEDSALDAVTFQSHCTGLLDNSISL